MMKQTIIAPSLLAADFSKLRDEIKRVEDAGAEWLHLDVMDGHFVPNLTIGPVVVEWIRRCTKLTLDVHLMIEDPLFYVGPFCDAGADSLTFHAEAVAAEGARVNTQFGATLKPNGMIDATRANRVIEAIRKRGKRVGVAINPDTAAQAIGPVVKSVDMVLVMTVWPGFGGQKYIESATPKVTEVRAMADNIDVEVDGGLNLETVSRAARAGANVIVAGTAAFRSDDVKAVIAGMREKVKQAR